MKTRRYLPVAIWALAIMIVSSIPHLNPPSTKLTFADKVAHFSEYMVFGFLLARASFRSDVNLAVLFWVCLLVGAAYGVLDEFHQYFIPGRDSDVLDAAADVLGSASGTAAYLWWKVKRRPRELKDRSSNHGKSR